VTNLPAWAEALPLGREVAILATDPCGLLAFNKPAGIRSHPNPPAPAGDDAPPPATSEATPPGTGQPPPAPPRACLLRAHYDFAGEFYYWCDARDGTPRRLHLLNRLDSPTSGVILGAVDEEAAAAVRAQFAANKVEKIYHAIIKGRPPAMPDTWVDTLKRRQPGKDRKTGGILVGRGEDAIARTRYQYLGRDRNNLGLSHVRLMPKTGRTHQLRVQCSLRKAPIVGDKTYGDFTFNRRLRKEAGIARLVLHSAETRVDFVCQGKVRHFEARAPLPGIFKEVLEHNSRLWLIASAPAKKVPARQRPGRPR